MRFLALACSFAFASVAGCSLFTSLGGFSDGEPAQPPPAVEGGAAANEGGVVVEGGGADARLPIDPPIDAATPFCPTKPGAKFCSDFDRIVNLDDEWTRQVREPPTDVRIGFETSRSVSSARSLRIFMPALGGGTYYGLIEKRFMDVPARGPVRIDFDVFIPKPAFIIGSGGNVSFFSFGYYGEAGTSTNISQEMFLNSNGDSALTTLLKRNAPDQYAFTPTASPLPHDRWAHVRMDLNMKGGAGSYVRIWFDSEQVIDNTSLTYMDGPHDFMYLSLGFGRYNNGATPAFEAFYDNVVVETQ